MKCLFLCALVLLLAAGGCSASVTFTTQNPRRIGWWWDSPSSAVDPQVDALLGWLTNNSDVATSLLMTCGPSTHSGSVTGNVSAACERVMHELPGFGVKAELWLGQTSSVAAAQELLSYPERAVAAIDRLVAEHPTISGINFDLEVSNVQDCTINGTQMPFSSAFATFLRRVRQGMGMTARTRDVRITADVSCEQNEVGWAPIIGNCSALAGAADRLLNMATYHGTSFANWKDSLAPALNQVQNLDQIGIGSGCYYGDPSCHGQCGKWSLTAKSAEQRVCLLMNSSVVELDMFRLQPWGDKPWPQPWWIPQLRKFMKGGGCDV